MLRLIFILLSTSIAVHAEPVIRHVWDLVYPARVHPEQYTGRTVGHFGRKFVGVPNRRVHPNPITPKRLIGKAEAGVVRAALLIGTNGYVKDVAVLGKTPEDVIDESLLNCFRKTVFVPEKEGKKAIEYETEMVLVFKPVIEKKG